MEAIWCIEGSAAGFLPYRHDQPPLDIKIEYHIRVETLKVGRRMWSQILFSEGHPPPNPGCGDIFGPEAGPSAPSITHSRLYLSRLFFFFFTDLEF